MNHKNFHFTQISGKTNDIMFFKSPKTMVLGYFSPFMVIFAEWELKKKKKTGCHTQLYPALNIMLSFRKN